MAQNELTTKLTLDIKPFLDAIKRATTAVQNIVEIRPKFDSTEFRNLQSQILGFKPVVNVGVNVGKTSLDAVESEIALIGQDPINLQVLVNSEEIQTSVERIRELRSTALNIPAKTDIKVDTNAETVKKDFTDLTNSVKTLDIQDANIDLQINQDEIISQINSVKTNLDSLSTESKTIDLSVDEQQVNSQINSVKKNVSELTSEEYIIKLNFDDAEFQRNVANVRRALGEDFIAPISPNNIFDKVKQEINKVEDSLANVVEQLKQTNIGAEIAKGANVGDLISDENVAQVEKVILLLNELKENRNIELEFNDEELALAIGVVRSELDKFKITLGDIDNITLDNESIKRYSLAITDAEETVKQLKDELTALNKEKLQQIFPGLESTNRGLLDTASRLEDIRDGIKLIEDRSKTTKLLDFKVDEKAKQEILSISDSVNKIPTVRDIFIDIIGEEKIEKLSTELPKIQSTTATVNIQTNADETSNDVEKLGDVIQNLPSQKSTKVDAQDVPQTISELNQVQKEVNDIPNQKNIKINVDSAGASKAGQAISGVSGFVGQLSSGLLASFSGAAIGAAIANFGTQAVRAIASASDKADELNDKLKLAFTQAGASQGFELETQLQNANEFALDLGENFGISITRSKELLAQVVGLTGEFGSTSESITKASIGIEEATAGLVKAETAAKLFSRSIGNPEDQAALETLAKRFPAIGEAIQGATDPAEKANAVLQNLTGTFTALEEKAQGFGEQFQLLSEVAFGTFATALIPIFDAFVPILESFRKVITDNAEGIASFGNQITKNFVEPLVSQLLALGPQFATFFEGLFKYFTQLGSVSFGAFTTGLQILAPLLEIVGNTLIVLTPLFQEIANIVSASLVPVFELFNGTLDNALDPLNLFTEDLASLSPVIETVKNLADLLLPILRLFGFTLVNTVIPAVQGLEAALGLLVLPFRLVNLLFDGGRSLADKFGISLVGLAENIGEALYLFGPLAGLIGKLLPGIAKISQTPIDPTGLVTPVVKATKSFGDLNGLIAGTLDGLDLLNKAKFSPDTTGGGGGGGKANKELEKTLSILEQQLLAYDELAKRVEARYNLELSKIDLAQKARSAELGRQLNDNEKLAFAIQKVNTLTEQQNELQKALSTQFGISTDSINKLAKGFLETGNLASIPIKINGQNITFDDKDPKTVESFKKVADLLVKTLDTSIKLEVEQTEIKIGIAPEVELQSETVITNLDSLEQSVNQKLQQLEFGKLDIGEFDVVAIKQQYDVIANTSRNALEGLRTQLDSTSTSIKNAEQDLLNLSKAGESNSQESIRLNEELGRLKEQYKTTSAEVENYTGALQVAEERTNSVNLAAERAASQGLSRLLEIQSFQLELDLNADGLQQGLIEVELDFFRRLKTIENEGKLSLKRLEAEGAGAETLKKVADAQANIAQEIRAQRIIAIREFLKENNAIFAITESISKNLSNALNPDTTQADRRLKERQKELNSELEILRANLDIEQELNENNLAQRNLSYQEYNAKLLDIEREKKDAQLEYDKEVEQARLDGFKRIADEALPAINKQLEVESAKFTDLLKQGTADFETFANKGLEVIGLVAAQSLGVAISQAQSLEDVQKLFVQALVKNVLQILKVQLAAAILQAIFRDVEKAGTLGLLTGAFVTGALTALFLKAEKEILALAGYEKGGYTGDAGTKDIAGVVHGQEYVVNAKATKQNMGALEWVNKTGKTFEEYVAKTQKGALSNDKFAVLNEQVLRNFDARMNNLELKINDKSTLNIQNYVDTKSIGTSINQLAYTMDSRLSSLETTVNRAIRDNATLTRSANQLDVSVYSDPGTTIKHMRKIGKIKGLS